MILNKIDLLPHLEVDLDRLQRNLDTVNPGVERILVSARTGEGIDDGRSWLRADVFGFWVRAMRQWADLPRGR